MIGPAVRVLTVGTCLLVSACSGAGGEPDLRPVDVDPPADGLHAGAGYRADATPPDTEASGMEPPGDGPVAVTDGAATGGTPPLTDEPSQALVDEVLRRYDVALSALAVDPAALAAAGSPERARWDSVVLPGSPLSDDLLSSLVRRQREDRLVVVPPPGRLSYLHRALLVDPPRAGAVSFTWCGWSPGIGRDADSGEVVDDAVGHARGTGQLRLVGDVWMLEALDEVELDVLAPGSPDPCPAEAADARRPVR